MSEQHPPKLRIELSPENGPPKILIDAGLLPDGSTIQLYSSNGTMIELITSNNGGHLAIWDSKGRPRVMLGIDENNHTGLLLEDSEGKRVLSVTSDPSKPVITAFKNNTPVFSAG